MTDEEIIKGYCKKKLCPPAQEIINRQKAEIEKLQKRLEEQKHALFEQQAYTAELQTKIDGLQDEVIIKTDMLNKLKADIEQLNKNCQDLISTNIFLVNRVEKAKSEAIKEFAERLKDKDYDEFIDVIYARNVEIDRFEFRKALFNNFIDNLVKEMTE